MKYGADVNAMDDWGSTPLHYAAFSGWHGRPDVIRRLVENGARLDVRDEDGQTPLHESVRCMKLENARMLLELGADSGVKDAEGLTPRALAVERMERPWIGGNHRGEFLRLFDEKGITE